MVQPDHLKKSPNEFLEHSQEIRLVNPEALQSYFALDGLLEEVFAVFEEHGPEQIQKIRTALTENRALDASKAAHKLKGSCLTIGAARMSVLANYLEDRLKELAKETEDLTPFLPVLQALEDLFPTSLSSIRELA